MVLLSIIRNNTIYYLLIASYIYKAENGDGVFVMLPP